MFRKMFWCGGALLLAGAVALATPTAGAHVSVSFPEAPHPVVQASAATDG